MTILGLEFSSDVRSAALSQGGAVCRIASELGGRSTQAFDLVSQVLQAAVVEREAVETIAVGLGPGSYTGIRVAIALAQGWQLAREIRLLGISTADVLAEQARSQGMRGRIQVVIDAQRAEFYRGTYELDDAGARVLETLRLAKAEDVQKAADPIVGPPVLAGRLPGLHPLWPDAGILVRLAVGRADYVAGRDLQPIYLRETSFVKAPPARIIAPEPK
jgi:tRNA threonylcarbamoyladenosine biosynthesis protein TsaB